MSLQVVARARDAGPTCRPRDVFGEHTVARLGRADGSGHGAAEGAGEGVGPVPAPPILGSPPCGARAGG
ncbi:hypothetical protein, partial [Mycobacterium avium]|uniref:hypothetical protein n=1 Tax=Mycobacterium avium TaxID=1764 RepID=UPI003AFA5B9E